MLLILLLQNFKCIFLWKYNLFYYKIIFLNVAVHGLEQYVNFKLGIQSYNINIDYLKWIIILIIL